MKNTLITVLVVGIIIGGYFIIKNYSNTSNVAKVPAALDVNIPTSEAPANPAPIVQNKTETVIGRSVEGRDIIAYHFGTGDRELLLVGDIHGGYSWNTALVAFETMDYLKANPTVVPTNIKVTVIPVMNPDGLYKATGKVGLFTPADVSKSQTVLTAGRFNANKVDLSRNFDCNWQTNANWQNTTVSGGSAVFSEPEAKAIKNYVEINNPKAVVVWYSAAGGVYSSSCGGGVLPQTKAITDLYAKASGYKAYDNFDAYATTGDMVNWLAKIKIPAISVLLTNHTDTESTQNQKGVVSLLEYYSK
ncbi:MAG: M14 family zinc carboxypeptidase [Minisyncoccia bacterium]